MFKTAICVYLFYLNLLDDVKRFSVTNIEKEKSGRWLNSTFVCKGLIIKAK